MFPKEIYYAETHSKSTFRKGDLNKYQEEFKPKEGREIIVPGKREDIIIVIIHGF